MKFQKYLANSCVSEWQLAYVDYKSLKKYVKGVANNSEDAFLRELQLQLHKVVQFYHQQCATLPGRMAFIDNMINQEIGIPVAGTEDAHDASPLGSTRNTMKDIKYARFLLKEYHHYCMFLVNYQKLNKIAFAKILKKYDKIHETNLKERFCDTFVNDAVFLDTTASDHAAMAQRKLADIFDYLLKHRPKAVRFHHYSGSTNPRTLAMQYLRGSQKQNDEFAFFRVGCYVGISSVLTILSIIQMFSIKDAFRDPVWISVLYMYGGMFIVVLSFFGFSCDLYIWKRFRINYVFIFEFNTNHSLTYKQFTEFAALSLFLWALCLYFTVFGTLSSFFPFQYIPLMLIGFYVVILVLPVKIFYWRSRKWFLKTLFHIFTPGFRKVTFKDYFIADILISLTFFWTSLYLTVCFYVTNPTGRGSACNPRKSWITPLLLSIPLLVRFVQCCRKMYDVTTATTKSRHFCNAIKYVLSIITVYMSTWAIVATAVPSIAMWVMFATVSALYSYYWDVTKDWNVAATDKVIPKRFLKTAVVVNFFLRFNWILTISTFLLFNQMLISFAFGCLEVVRRYMWALFRMELEHTNNMENFRATKDIPLLEEEDDKI